MVLLNSKMADTWFGLYNKSHVLTPEFTVVYRRCIVRRIVTYRIVRKSIVMDLVDIEM